MQLTIHNMAIVNIILILLLYSANGMECVHSLVSLDGAFLYLLLAIVLALSELMRFINLI